MTKATKSRKEIEQACPDCGQVVVNVLKHRWAEHRDVMMAITAKATAANPKMNSGPPAGNGGKPPAEKKGKTAPATTSQILESVHTVIVPRTFTMNSALLWQAMQAAIREWGFPADMTAEEFLDGYLFTSFYQRGILLGGYSVISNESPGNGDGGNDA